MNTKNYSITRIITVIIALLFISYGIFGLINTKTTLEYVAPYEKSIEPQKDENDDLTVPKIDDKKIVAAINTIKKTMPTAIVGGCIVSQNVRIMTKKNTNINATVYGVSDDWFSINYHKLSRGNLLPKFDIFNPSILINANTAYEIWGSRDVIGSKIDIGNIEFKIAGVLENEVFPINKKQYTIYVPMVSMYSMNIEPEIQLITVKEVISSYFQKYTKNLLPYGKSYDLKKEKTLATLSLRYIIVLLLIILIKKALNFVNDLNKYSIDKWKERHNKVYAAKMIIPSILISIQFIIGYSIIIAGIYLVLTISVAPLYIFPEWIPSDPSKLQSIISTIQKVWANENMLVYALSPNVLQIRFCGSLINIGVVLLILSQAFRFSKNKKNNQKVPL